MAEFEPGITKFADIIKKYPAHFPKDKIVRFAFQGALFANDDEVRAEHYRVRCFFSDPISSVAGAGGGAGGTGGARKRKSRSKPRSRSRRRARAGSHAGGKRRSASHCRGR